VYSDEHGGRRLVALEENFSPSFRRSFDDLALEHAQPLKCDLHALADIQLLGSRGQRNPGVVRLLLLRRRRLRFD
jgi:hypothetical protein